MQYEKKNRNFKILIYLFHFFEKNKVRVLSLPLNSPLMRVLTGVELLLAGTNDWEAYAPKEVT